MIQQIAVEVIEECIDQHGEANLTKEEQEVANDIITWLLFKEKQQRNR